MNRKKKHSFGHHLFSAIGWLLLAAILALIAGFFLLRDRMSKEKLVLDDIAVCADTPSTGSARHLSFNSAGDMTLSFDKNDLWYFLRNYYGTDWLEQTNASLAAGHLTLTGMGLELTQETGIVLNVEADWLGNRLAFRVPCKMTFVDGTLTVRPVELLILEHSVDLNRLLSSRLARLFHITKEELRFSYTPELTFLERIESITVVDGAVRLTGPLATGWLDQSIISSQRIRIMSFLQRDCRYIGPVLSRYAGEPIRCFDPVLPVMESDPAVFTSLLDQFYALIPSASHNLPEKNEGMLWRWYPDYQTDYTAESFRVREDYEVCFKILKSISSHVSSSFTARNVSVRKGQLLYRNTPFTPESFFGDNYGMYSRYFDLEQSRFCFYLRFPYGYPDCPVTSKLLDSQDALTEVPEKDLSYAPALLLRGTDGHPYVLAFTGGEEYEICELAEEAFYNYTTAEKIPLVDLRLPAETEA